MCSCVNVDIGSYANQVTVRPPSLIVEERLNLGLNSEICLDRCIAQEVQALWVNGIITTGCCCGHNKTTGFIGVRFEHIQEMKLMGYKVRFNPSRPGDEDSFVPRTV